MRQSITKFEKRLKIFPCVIKTEKLKKSLLLSNQ